MHKFWTRIEKIEHDVTVEPRQTLIESIPSRVAATVKTKGGPTKY